MQFYEVKIKKKFRGRMPGLPSHWGGIAYPPDTPACFIPHATSLTLKVGSKALKIVLEEFFPKKFFQSPDIYPFLIALRLKKLLVVLK